ncbi:MAG: DUF1573 domain-containing protein [Muribaculaceae bacterium]|nr:DUF1573 domain-containing protein [Muribaculaceae bacterium]
MKRIALTLIVVMLGVLAMTAAEKYAQATFPVQQHDFGTIKEDGGPVSTTFEVINTGNKPLLILDVLASCGCTRPEFPTKPIKPGKKAKIKVTFSPLGRAGAFRKTVKVRTNGREMSNTLYIEGTIVPGKRKK